ncbi:histidine phosphatase family protein [Oceanobacillus sp. Castelsardo]|uniref:histidine phosphatase family protein n=1 Tax=Oceanobacillus sp. Castelsardo TaxID=1851204 RepID=UPI0008387624|nr:histidine phosphatase family protein [Oceanobacillus sp. Castelsardo]
MKLFVVRHGETEWNVQKRLQGHLDSPLTANGIHHAKLLAKKLESISLDSIISSPSERAMHTARIVSGNRTIAIETDKRLKEINLGSWQGKTFEEIKAMDPFTYENYVKQPHLYKREEEGAETLSDVINRLHAFLRDVESTYHLGNHLIVTHGVVVKALQLICKNNSIEQIWEPPDIDGTSLTIVEIIDGKRKMLVEGDISHKE